MNILNRLGIAACGMHGADQIALVCVPLAASIVFAASPEVIGLLVACQSLAHLAGSLPFGVLVDRCEPRSAAITAALISATGFAGCSAGIAAGSLFWFGLSVTFAGFGIVLFVLAVLSILPRLAGPAGLARANARIEIPRAAAAFVAPLVVGLLVTDRWPGGIFPVACAGALVALAALWRLPRLGIAPAKRGSVAHEILGGGRFVLRHPLLLPIALCAVFWNLAFPALLVAMVPLVTDVFRTDPGVFGIALSAFGLAGVAGSFIAGRAASAISPRIILLFGPGSSLAATVLLSLVPAGAPDIAIYLCFFLLGFGPSMWLIAQNSVRQIVTPPGMLGRVNATIQTTIYGIRPLGALVGGTLAGAMSPMSALLFVVAGFGLSFAAAAFSDLRTVRAYADLAPAQAA